MVAPYERCNRFGILSRRYFKMRIDRWTRGTQDLEVGRPVVELSLICETVARQAGTAFLCRLVVC